MEEIWKAIQGYEGLYEVSSCGNVRRVFTKTKLSVKDVQAILQARAEGIPSRALAVEFGVTYHAIDILIKKRTYTQRAPHLLKLQRNNKGYWQVGLSKDGKVKLRLVHVLVAAAFLGEKYPGMEINHINGIKTDSSSTNLEYVTRSQNSLHAYRTGLVPLRNYSKGSHRPAAKLTETDIPVIRAMAMQGASNRAIARHFQVGSSAIDRIFKGQTWNHVP